MFGVNHSQIELVGVRKIWYCSIISTKKRAKSWNHFHKSLMRQHTSCLERQKKHLKLHFFPFYSNVASADDDKENTMNFSREINKNTLKCHKMWKKKCNLRNIAFCFAFENTNFPALLTYIKHFPWDFPLRYYLSFFLLSQ